MTASSDSASGVDYSKIDPSKISGQQWAATTTSILSSHPFPIKELSWTRGESVYVQAINGLAIASITESLGSKNLIGDIMRGFVDKTFYDALAQDTVAMIVNDMITLGVIPTAIMMQVAAGHSDWFADKERMTDLQRGWAAACQSALGTWGGGESPALKTLVHEKSCVLSGSATGLAWEDDLLGPHRIQDGDAIILLMGTGLHANGATSARELGESLGPENSGFLTRLSDGRTFGEALLDPTPIYVKPIHACLQALPGAVHYGVNITGHGWRKLMRAPQPHGYAIHKIPPVPPVLQFLQEQRGLSDEAAYGAYNMGAGFALYVSARKANDVVKLLNGLNCQAYEAGTVFESSSRCVVIEPLKVNYEDDDLNLR